MTSSQHQELSIYTHNTISQEMKKCSICHSSTSGNKLLKLPDEFQEHAAKKGFESYYCCSCCQVVNFCI